MRARRCAVDAIGAVICRRDAGNVHHMTTLVSFNINGIRSRAHQLRAIAAQLDPDILGLQETKVADEDFPRAVVAELGYTAEIHGQKGHYGVALLGKQPPQAPTKGLPGDDAQAQRRLIAGTFALAEGTPLVVLNAYFPQGENRDHPVKFPAKQRFYADLLDCLRTRFTPDQALVVMGDMNVAPDERDVGLGADNARRWLRTGKCCFLPEERAWLQALLDWGLYDSFRVLHPETVAFSWFDYRSRGFERTPRRGLRIDLILVTAPLVARLRDAGIADHLRALEQPSDHCPVWVRLA